MDTTASRPMSLRSLLAGHVAQQVPDVQIRDLTLDSREVRPGMAFIALPGTRTHGIGFAAQAAAAGATAILWEPTPQVAAPPVPAGTELVAVDALSRKIGEIAARFFGDPTSGMRVVGVTGTNGKTTCAHVVAEAMQHLGERSAYIGTLGHGLLGDIVAGSHTTPDAITLQRRLRELRHAGAHCLGMEVSSHALHQHRVGGTHFRSALFTNLTRDHLDYHGTLEAYGAAKAALFTWPGLEHAVVNAGDAYGRTLARDLLAAPAAPSVVVYARNASMLDGLRSTSARSIFAREVRLGEHGLEIDVDGSWGPGLLRSRFIGEFNAENLLGVLGVLLANEIELPRAIAALERCSAPPGRMQALSVAGSPLAIVDYAHTPDALEKALQAVRTHCAGRLTCVFGCGGDRDRGKRPLMGAVAERLADRIVITDDNPRTEDGDAIVADILAGLREPQRALVCRDRALAIQTALRESSAGDAVLIAGKGHEDYQIVGTERRAFSDSAVAGAALRLPAGQA